MKSKLYVQTRTAVQDYYYDLRGRSPANFKWFSDAGGALPDYVGRYLLMNEVHRRLHPFQFVRPGDTVLHVGFDRVYLDKGQSHPLIFSALVGGQGRVVAMDPDPRNTGALREYARNNGIQNLEVADGAVWKETGELEFVFDGEWSPMSVATNLMNDPDAKYVPGKGSTKLTVPARPLDLLVPKLLPGRKVTYLSLTANGAEPEILQGAEELLRATPELRIGIALANHHHFSYNIRKRVCDQLAEAGYTIAVADAPHDPWMGAVPFYFACAVRLSHEELVAAGFQPSDWATIEARADAGEAKAAARSGRNRVASAAKKILRKFQR